MDIYSLAAAQLHAQPQAAHMSARAEDHYYANQIVSLPLHPRLLGPIWMLAALVLFLSTSLL